MTDASRRAHNAHENYVWIVVDELADTFQRVTGKRASGKVREAIYDAIRFDA